MQSALKLTVHVGEDHVVTLPDEVPVGPAEIIVLLDAEQEAQLLEELEPVQPRKPVHLSDLVREDRG